jgi:hypothetical protein
MLTGELPLRPTRPEVWRMVKDGFNANEIAHFCGVSPTVAEGMIAEATPRRVPEPAYGWLERSA